MEIDRSSVFVVTDTSTLCLYDLAQLKHRIDDDADWWVDPVERLREEQCQRVVFMDLQSDGKFRLFNELLDWSNVQRQKIVVPSGRLFLGAADEITSEGMEPTLERGGRWLDVRPGVYDFYWNVYSNSHLMEYTLSRISS